MSNFRIYNDRLCPDLWDEYAHLDPRVRVNLLRMAYDFYEKTDFKAPIIDVYLMGSIANYNWNPASDADIHIIIDYDKLQMPPETAGKAVKTAGAQWNLEHEIDVKGHKVEINFQNAKEVKPHVTGIYSLVKDQWIRVPTQQNIQVDKNAIQLKYSGLKKYIESVLRSGNRDTMKAAKKYLDAFRQYGLDTCGELSLENIVFKILRSKGLIKMLKDGIVATYDKEMTVTEDQKDDLIKSRLPYLNDDALFVVISRLPEFPEKDYVQVDDNSGGENHLSSNPESMNKMGYAMPSSKELLRLPMGKYKLSDAKAMLKKLSEVAEKDIKSRFPPLSAVHKDYIKLHMMTLDNLKSMREKAARMWKASKGNEDPTFVQNAMQDFQMFDNELKRRLKIINAPVYEGYGAGVPEEDRLHIPGNRWQIRSKDAPKTPKMEKETVMVSESIVEDVDSKNVYLGYVTRDHEVLFVCADRIPEKYDGHDYLIALNRSIDTRRDSSWRYRKDLNTVFWDVGPDEDCKATLEDWIRKNLGASNPTHKLINQNDIMSWIRKGSDTRIAHGIDENGKK